MPLEKSAAPPPPITGAPAFEQDLSAGSLVSRSLSLWWKNIWRFAGISAIVFVPVVLVAGGLGVGFALGHGPVPTGAPAAQRGPILSLLAVVVPLLIVAGVVQMGALTYGAVQHLGGRPVRFGAMLSAGFGRLLPLIGAGIVTALLVWVGFLLLVVPGIIIACGLAATIPAVVAERKGPIEALRRSWGLTRGYRGKIFLAGLVLLLIQIGLNLVSNLFSLVPILGVLAALFVQVLTMSLSTVLPAVAYHDLRTKKEGASTEELAKVFE